jgi:acyl carrier protein
MEANREHLVEIIKTEVGNLLNVEDFKDDIDLTDQGVDSLDRTSIFLAIEDAYDVSIPDEDYEKLLTINDIISYLKNA